MIKKTLEIECNKLFFDFDGVIVDSNKFKEDAISESIRQINNNDYDASKAILFFNQNAGIGREKKLLKFFSKEIVDQILSKYSEKCLEFFSQAKPTEGFIDFIKLIKKYYPNVNIFILSGGKSSEIKNFLELNNINVFFDKILGDNISKKEHLVNEKASIKDLFFGDSRGDMKTAKNHPLGFILVKKFSSKLSRPNLIEEKDAKFSIDSFLDIKLKV